MKRKPAKRNRHEYAKALALFLLISLAAEIVRAQPVNNPPEVQTAFEAAAAKVRNLDDGTLKVGEVIFGDRSLTIRFQPSAGASREKAEKKVKARMASWAGSLCSHDGMPDFLRRTGAKFITEFETAPGAYEKVKEVSAAACDGTTDLRLIDGKPLYPKPTYETAIGVIKAHLKGSLLDYDSAKLECSEVSAPLWIKLPLEPRRYGYVVECDINAKNAFGGYVGYQRRWYYFNGNNFQEIINEPRAGLVEQ
ncbi:hypothetical protein [Sphingobium estronivorans]|uniref:hypothetical protein n=1 Tax=Sphingobium estronivorans TaxID=1577690 RepID=UPI00123ABD26|nr:hypothetical protein [Sphingobium estronivorans]